MHHMQSIHILVLKKIKSLKIDVKIIKDKIENDHDINNQFKEG